MTNRQIVERNIGLTFDFLRQVLRNPSMLDEIPSHSVIEFVEKDFTIKESASLVKPDKYLKVKTQLELMRRVSEKPAPYKRMRKPG